jgi:CRISPR type III-B/RAMP module-associated protein Cmr5
MLDIERRLSQIALEDAKSASKKDWSKKYKSLVKGFGSRIMNNTLLGAMAFLASKGEDHHTELFKNIAKAVGEVYPKTGWKNLPSDTTKMFDMVLKFLSKEDVATVMHTQELALKYISYLRRYVSAFIEGEDENS